MATNCGGHFSSNLCSQNARNHRQTHHRPDRAPSNPINADLKASLQQNVANEQASPDGETDRMASEASRTPGSAPAPSPPSPQAPGSVPSASSEAFFAPPRKEKKKKIKTGNFRLTVDVLPHPVFSRRDDGADLYTSVAISLEEALAGFAREITALDGSLLVVR